MLLDCTPVATRRGRFQFKQFWLKLDSFNDVVAVAWGTIDGDPESFRRLVAKLKHTARQLMSWADKVDLVKL